MILSPSPPGRGATGDAASGRFNDRSRSDDGDWLDDCTAIDGAPPRLRTSVTIERPRTIISCKTSPDIPFSRSTNAYRGCEHGCVYCFARPTRAFLNLSPGLDFESRLFAEPDASALLRAELSKRGYACQPIALGANTDPYQPIERDWRITRAILEVLAEFRHPVTITTKSDRVVRDIDILAPMAADGLVAVMISVTSLDPATAHNLEPRAPAPHRRIDAIRQLSAAGIPVQISVSPIIPTITDHDVEAIVAAGASGAFSIPIRLPDEVALLFRAWLTARHTDRAARVMSHISTMRGGRDNDPDFHTRFRGAGAFADLIRMRFAKAVAKHGLNRARFELRTDLFRVPSEQLLLF